MPFATAAPLAAVKVIVTELEIWEGSSTELGLKLAVTPDGRPEAENVKLPDTVPIAVSVMVAVSFWLGATISGCGMLRESWPVEATEVVVPEDEEVVDIVVDVLVVFETIGIST